MGSYLAFYPSGGACHEAWVRVSPTQLRRKLFFRWTRTYKGIPSASSAEEVMGEALSYSNVEDASAAPAGGGYWTVTATILDEQWTNDYKAG